MLEISEVSAPLNLWFCEKELAPKLFCKARTDNNKVFKNICILVVENLGLLK
jgi:hypothetical protein